MSVADSSSRQQPDLPHVHAPFQLLPFDVHQDEILPRYATAADLPWLRALLEELRHCEGLPVGKVDERCAGLSAHWQQERLVRFGVHVLRRAAPQAKAQTIQGHRPADIRWRLYQAGSRAGTTTQQAWQQVARDLHTTRTELEAAFCGDLPDERLTAAPPDWLTPHEAVAFLNLTMAQTVLSKSLSVEIQITQHARALVLRARRLGLLCSVPSNRTLHFQGPLATLCATTRYGRALARLLPLLPWCAPFQLTANIQTHDSARRVRFRADNSDRWACDPPPRQFDSRLEEVLARKLERMLRQQGNGLQLLREPEPILANDGRLFFPDFGLCDAAQPIRRCLIEVCGFWTPEYLRDKRRLLDAVRDGAGPSESRFLLCIDESHGEALGVEREPDPHIHILPYRRRPDPHQVLDAARRLLGREKPGH